MPSSTPDGQRPSTPQSRLTPQLLPSSPSSAAIAGLQAARSTPDVVARPIKHTPSANGVPKPPVSSPIAGDDHERLITLELQDGEIIQGYSFGAEKSVAGELVFQTGMVGYPESITDPSYRGQILVITFPLVGNYGVPSREIMDKVSHHLPQYFEANEIHIAGLVCASYSGEDFSHHLASSSLGTWLKEQGVPAMYGVDTRALTKRIREEGSMLGRMLLQKSSNTSLSNGLTNGTAHEGTGHDWRESFDSLDWSDPNTKNLVADGKKALISSYSISHWLIMSYSINQEDVSIFTRTFHCVEASVRTSSPCSLC